MSDRPAEDYIPLEKSSSKRAGDVVPNNLVVTNEDIARVRQSAIRGHMKFAHIKNKTRRIHIAAATIEQIEAELAYIRNIATWYQQENAKIRAEQSAVRWNLSSADVYARMECLIDENKKLMDQVEHHKNMSDEYAKMYNSIQLGLSNSIDNYGILRDTYDRLRAQHPLPAERTFPRRPKRPADNSAGGSKKRSK